jgi:hypothetical protein
MPRRRQRRTPRPLPLARRASEAAPAAASEDLLEACRQAVSRVLAEMPARDREALEVHRARVIEGTHRDTRAALEEIRGVLNQVA